MRLSQISIVSSLILILLLASNSYGAVEFDGSDDYITVGGKNDFEDTSFTVSLWIKESSPADWDRVCGKEVFNNDRSWVVICDNSSPKEYYFIVWQSDETSVSSGTVAINNSEYNHIVGTYDGTTVKIFANYSNTSDDGGTADGTIDDCGGVLRLGRHEADSDPWPGEITEFAYWDTVLSDSEIELLYKSRTKRMPLQIQPSNLKLYLPLDDHPHNDTGNSANGNTFKDLSSYGNDGTASGCNAQAEEVLSYP